MSYTSKFTGADIDDGIEKAQSAVRRNGDSMTGPLLLHDVPTHEKGAATKKYVDDAEKAKAYADEKDEATLKAANAHAEEKANSVLSQAKEHANSIIPSALPNPASLKFTGATNKSYDGSSAVEVEIPSVPSLDGYATEDFVEQKIKEIDIPSVEGLASEDFVARQIEEIDIPEKLPTPNALTFTGSASGTYDGSSPKTVNIPSVAGLASEEYVDQAVEGINIPTRLPNPSAIKFTGAVDKTYDGSNTVEVEIPSVPESLKNPNALTFTGAVSGTYDGSEALEINIPEGGSGGSGVSSWNDLADRPFGVETRTLILKEQIVVLDGDGFATISTPLNGVPVAGANYVVKWSLETHECTGQDVSSAMGTTAIVLGNIGAVAGGEGTGEPFVIILYPEGLDGKYAEIHATDTRYHGAHVVIKIESIEVSKIPEELLPTLPTIMFVNVEGDDPSEFVPDKSYLEAAVAMASGQMVYLKRTHSDGIAILPCIALSSEGAILFAAPISTGMNLIYMWSADGTFIGT